MEHLRHFNLSDDPFRNEPIERFMMETGPYVDALHRVERAVRQNKGLVVLVGPVGVGKSQVVRRLFDDLEEEVFEASMMVVLRERADSNWLLNRFARQLGVEEPSEEREELITQLHERLAIVREDGRHAVLIVDDAHGLATRATLREICGLLKLEYEDRRMLTIVLSGSPELEQALSYDPLLAHHIEVKVSMRGLGPGDGVDYLEQRLARAGGAGCVIEADAAARLHALAGGVPGLMNVIADNALFEAYLAGRSQVTCSDVELAQAALGWSAPEGEVAEDAAIAGASRAPLDSPAIIQPTLEPAEIPLDPPDLESELEAVFETAAQPEAVRGLEGGTSALRLEPISPVEGPPKDSDGDDVEQLLVELLED